MTSSEIKSYISSNSSDKEKYKIWRVINTPNLFIFDGPSTHKTKKVGNLPINTIIEQLDRKGDWILHRKGWSLRFYESEAITYLIPVKEPIWKVINPSGLYTFLDHVSKASKIVWTLQEGDLVRELDTWGEYYDWILTDKGWAIIYTPEENRPFLIPLQMTLQQKASDLE